LSERQLLGDTSTLNSPTPLLVALSTRVTEPRMYGFVNESARYGIGRILEELQGQDA
jgi:hypothetical protein